MLLAILQLWGCEPEATVIKIAVTSDIHGMIYPTDLINRESTDHSLAHVYQYVRQAQNNEDTVLFLLDNGDLLQGQPAVYYYNFIDTVREHLAVRVMNFMGYRAGTVGNHDIEAGPQVYNRVRKSFKFPWLAANAVYEGTTRPFFQPYTVLEVNKRKIAVLGLITPGIPDWLPKSLWPAMEFRDMAETATDYIPLIREAENPDLVVGLFHAGTDAGYGGTGEPYLNENASLLVAENVPGFDVIFAGHDHRVSSQWVVNVAGDSVLVMDPGSHARHLAEVTVSFGPDHPKISGSIIPVNRYAPSEEFMDKFRDDYMKVTSYLDDTVSWLSGSIVALDALFGPSRLTSLLHRIQFDVTDADLSFTAPLSLTALLKEGPLLVSDLFKLYRYENMLYVMRLSGLEIDSYLEYSAGMWFNTMESSADHLLLFQPGNTPGRLTSPYYHFSSAAGIDYTVDVRRPAGDRVSIQGFSDGTPFEESAFYRVAMNSYRGSGGGGHLTRGAGIGKEALSERILWSSEKDLRYYLMEYLSNRDTVQVELMTNWSCIPLEWSGHAAAADRKFFQ